MKYEDDIYKEDKNLKEFQSRPIELKHLSYSALRLSIQCFFDSRKGIEKCNHFVESIVKKSDAAISDEIAFTEAFLSDLYSVIENKVVAKHINNGNEANFDHISTNKAKRAAKAYREAENLRQAATHVANAKYNEALSFVNSANLILEERIEIIKAKTLSFIENYLRKVKINVSDIEALFDDEPMSIYEKAHNSTKEEKSDEKE